MLFRASILASLLASLTAQPTLASDDDFIPLTHDLPFASADHTNSDNLVHLTQYQYNPAPYAPVPNDLDSSGNYSEDSYDDSTNFESGNFDSDSFDSGNLRYGILPDYFDFFHGLDASKEPQDFGVNGVYGGRISVNAAWILDEQSGLGWQLGTSLNYSENGLQITENLTGSDTRIQNFSTIGLFQRGDNGITWGAAFDVLYQDYYDNFVLGQWRTNLGFSMTEVDDLGVWLAIPQFSDRGFYGATPVKLTPVQQVNFYWRRIWQSNVVTNNWIGWAQELNDVNVLYGNMQSDGPQFVYGTEFHAPLNDHLAIYGQGNFIRPVDSGTLDAYVGLVLYIGGGAYDAPYRRNAPVHTVANNPMFAINLSP